MSFVFPTPVPQSRNFPSYFDSDYDYDYDENHHKLMNNPEPDYDELLIRLSLYVFNRLSPSDQRERVQEICSSVNVGDVQFLEGSDEAFRLGAFAEIFKKLNFSDQLKLFLSKVIQKFKHERQLGELISSFKQLDAEHQQQVIEKIVHVTPENLRNASETEEELRLRRFTQLSRDYTDRVYKLVVAWKQSNQDEQQETSDNENGSDCFAEFFFGFSIVWFQGQSSSSQELLIEQLSRGVRSSVVIENRLPHESEEDFKLTRFTELCKKVVDFGVQKKFLENAEQKLKGWPDQLWSVQLWPGYIHCPRMILEPQDSDSAAELLSLLTCFGFSLLPAMYQQKKIDEMSNQVEGVEIKTSPAAAANEEGIRMTRFTELFNQVPGPERIDIFKQFRSIFYQEKCYSQLIRFFSRLGSKDQAELIDKLFNKITKVDPWEEWDSARAQLIMEKFWGESEEEFRLRRFENMCIKHLCTCKYFVEDEAEERVLQLYRTSESDHNYHQESSRVAEFLFGVSIIWYKARCANYRRNPVQLILFGEVELGDVIEKLTEETEEEFRLRRFTESFKQLEFTSQVRIVDYIQDTLVRDLAYPVSRSYPIPVIRDCRNSSLFDEDHYKLMYNDELLIIPEPDYDKLLIIPEADYDELLIRLSLYAFNGLSPSDQREQVEEIRRNVNVVEDVEKRPEESDEAFRLRTFAELFKKLNFSDQLKLFLSKVIQKFKHERQLGELISSFKQLDAEHQQQVIEKIVHVTPENLRNAGETEELRLRRFTQLSRDYTDYVYKLVVAWKSDQKQEETSDNENGSDWKSCFFEFFFGFSIVWFQGQSSRSQDLLIEQLSKGVTGDVIDQRLQDDETERDFKLRRFTELCKKIVDFRVQEEFLNYAELKLERWGLERWEYDLFHYRLILEPQEYERAVELLSDLSTLGCSLLSVKYQRQKIEEMMSNLVEGGVTIIEETTDDDEEYLRTERFMYQRQKKIEEMMSNLVEGGVTIIEESSNDDHFRMTRFTELFNQVPVPTRLYLLKGLRNMLLQEKCLSEAVRFFGGLGFEDQTEMIQKLSYEIKNHPWEKCGPAELIIEKLSGESEEDFRLRRFKKVCSKHLSTRGYIIWPNADEERVRQGTSEESSPYASFLLDASITWFKARCTNYGRNPIHLILFGQVDPFRDVIEKLPEESEEDFRLRRFTESFKRLQFTSQERIVDYIQDALFRDLGYPVSSNPVEEGATSTPEGRGWFDSEWIKLKLPHLQDQGAAAATRGATTQAGAGGGQGTSTSTVR